MERKLKVNINENQIIISTILLNKEADLLIADKKIGDIITYKNSLYRITGATSLNGSFHYKEAEKRGREFVKGKKKKIMVESLYLDKNTNQIFLVRVD